MSCNEENQSAIQEARSQLFLDTADGGRLNNVTNNLGLDRPVFGMGDDEWRAVAKLIALQPKQIRNQFLRMLELCAGPQFARIGTLANISLAGDRSAVVLDGSVFVQLGTVVIDPTLPTEETVKYCIRDVTTGEFFFESPLAFAHTVIPPGSGRLRANANAGAGSLQLIDSSGLPTAGFPYPVMIDRGTLSEEIVQVTANNTGTNTLTLAAPTTFAHKSAITRFCVAPLYKAAPAGRTFIQLNVDATRNFPAAGWLRINENGGSDETVEYTSNDATLNVLYLKTPLKNSHAVGERVELVTPGALVEVAQVVEAGVHWALFETEPRNVTVILPRNLQSLRLLDASWLHDAVTPTTNGTFGPTLTTDDFLLLDTSAVPTAGILLLNNGLGHTQKVFYDLRLRQTDVTNAKVAANTLAGVKKITYTTDGYSNFPTPVGRYVVILDRGGANQETAVVVSADPVHNVLTFESALTQPHTAGQKVELVNQVLLDLPVGFAFVGGSTWTLQAYAYPGTVLEDGNYRDAFGAIRFERYPGGYIFNPGERGVSAINTLLATNIPPPTTVAHAQIVSRTNLEVVDASLWPAPPFSPYTVRIGEGSGHQEDRELIDRTLKADVAGTVVGPLAPGVLSVPYTLGTVQEFPESNGVFPAGYRIVLGKGTANEEIVEVSQNNIGTHVFTLSSATTKPHANLETVRMLNDVLTFDGLTQPHSGPQLNPSLLGESVRMFMASLPVSPAPTNFPTTGGWVWINFGREIVDVRKRITVIGSPTSLTLASTAAMPTSGYPYQIVVGPGRVIEEHVWVTNNDPMTNTLTLQAPGMVNTHAVGDYVEFSAGEPEVVEYQSKVTGPDRLVFQFPQLFDTKHIVGERVIYSPALSQSEPDGSSFGFKLPPDPGACLSSLFELVRAAGIQVTILER